MSHTRVGTFTNGAPPALNAGNLNILDSQYDDAMSDVSARYGIHVATYGAVGDGTTDDTTALQAAFTAARTAKTFLLLGCGLTYIVSGALNPTGVNVRGFGATLKVKAGVTVNFNVFAPTAPCTIMDVTIDLNKANTTDPAANTQGIGFYQFNSTGWTGQTILRNVAVMNGYQPGIRFGTASSLTDASLAPASRALIDSCRVESTKYGIFLQSTNGVTILNPSIASTTADGITEFQCRDTEVIGGRVASPGNHGVVTQYSYGFTCQGVSVDSAAVLGICVGGGSTTNVEARYFTITGNRVTNCVASGISVDTTKSGSPAVLVPSYSTISGNVSRGNTVHGIYLHNAQHVAVTGNTCQANGNGGLAMDSANVAVSGNVFVANAYGIKFQGTATGVYGSHAMGRNVVTGNTTSDYYYDTHGADNTTLDLQGTGSPETVVAAPVGSRFARADGGAATSMYVKETGTGNTGWIGK